MCTQVNQQYMHGLACEAGAGAAGLGRGDGGAAGLGGGDGGAGAAGAGMATIDIDARYGHHRRFFRRRGGRNRSAEQGCRT